MSSIVWEDPPEAEPPKHGLNNKQRDLVRFADELRAHPGKWAIYPNLSGSRTGAASRTSQIRKGRWCGGAGFEAEKRPGALPGKFVIYVRFVGYDA